MAGIIVHYTTGEVATGTAQITILQLVAPANQCLLLHEFSFSFAGTSNTAEPINCLLAIQTTAGTMTGLTGIADEDDLVETIQSSAQHTATVEPTTGATKWEELVHPQTGYTWIAPYGRAKQIRGGDRLGFLTIAAANVNCIVRATIEE